MRTLSIFFALCFALAAPLASAGAPVDLDDVTDGPCPGLVPTVMCAVDPVRHEVNRDVGIVVGLTWAVVNPVCYAAFDIVTGRPSCPLASAIGRVELSA